MAMTTAPADTRLDVAAAVCLFRSLADPTRLAIIACLAGGEQRVVDLTRRLGLAQSTHELDSLRLLAEVHKQVACLLADPIPRWDAA